MAMGHEAVRAATRIEINEVEMIAAEKGIWVVREMRKERLERGRRGARLESDQCYPILDFATEHHGAERLTDMILENENGLRRRSVKSRL